MVNVVRITLQKYNVFFVHHVFNFLTLRLKKSIVKNVAFKNNYVTLHRQNQNAMTLQQLEYIIAIAEHQHFVKAAEACGITQSTLSLMLKKLEDELDVVIFDRNSHPIKPTLAGYEIIKQASIVLFHSKQLQEMAMSERKKTTGNVRIAITPTIAPYIIPKLFYYIDTIPEVDIQASEQDRDKVIHLLKTAQVDMGIMSLPGKVDGLLEIPLYRERFFAYVSPRDPLYAQETVNYSSMPRERFWALRNEVCFRRQLTYSTDIESLRSSYYEAGNIATLLHIINENTGFTAIPELHLPMLRPEHLAHVRPLVNPVPERVVSLFVRDDYVHEGLLNVVADGIKGIIPEQMLDERLAKYPIRL